MCISFKLIWALLNLLDNVQYAWDLNDAALGNCSAITINNKIISVHLK